MTAKEKLIKRTVEMAKTIKGVQVFCKDDRVIVADEEYPQIRGVLTVKTEKAVFTVRELALTVRAVANQVGLIRKVVEKEPTFDYGEIREKREEADIVFPFLKRVKCADSKGESVEVSLIVSQPVTSESLKRANIEVSFKKSESPDALLKELAKVREITKIMRRD